MLYDKEPEKSRTGHQQEEEEGAVEVVVESDSDEGD